MFRRCVSLLILALPFFALSARAAPGDCDATGCVVFEVSIQLESYHDVPVVKETQYKLDLSGTVNDYQTVVARAGDTCTKQVKVPREIYQSINGIVGSISGGGGAPPVLTPAQQTMLLFYTTLMQQTLGFTCAPRDLGVENNSLPQGAGSSVPGTGTYPNPGNGSYPYPGTYPNPGNGSYPYPGTYPNPGSYPGTGTYPGTLQPVGHLLGIVEMPVGVFQALINEYGQTRNVFAGEMLLGGARIASIDRTSMVIVRGSEQRIVSIGAFY